MPVTMKPSDFPRSEVLRDPRTPPFRDEHGHYHVFSYEHVMKVLVNRDRLFTRDPSLWLPSEVRNIALDFMWTVEPFTVDGDDGRHGALRGVVEPWFRTKALVTMEPAIREISRDLINGLIADGRDQFNLARDLAYRVAIRVICKLVGIELDREDWLRDKLDEFNQTSRYEDLPPQLDLEEYFWEVVHRRMARPQNELLDVLIDAWRNGRISDRELLGYMAGMINAGTDTTGTSLVNAFGLLSEFGYLDEVRDALDDTQTVERVVEEVLRFGTPFPVKAVFVLGDTDFSGFEIPRRSTLYLWYAAANRDPAVNGKVQQSDPSVFDPRRWPNRHLALGYGKHYCLGADLAKLEMRVLLEEGLRRLPGLQWDQTQPFNRCAGIVDVVTEAVFKFNRPMLATTLVTDRRGEHDASR